MFSLEILALNPRVCFCATVIIFSSPILSCYFIVYDVRPGIVHCFRNCPLLSRKQGTIPKAMDNSWPPITPPLSAPHHSKILEPDYLPSLEFRIWLDKLPAQIYTA
ncbi:hypothetical protein TNCV_2584661 [Trichonephila clavipes]|nr:hypothetical protein TNCV_2584661 [Trichonephila clavipes]